MKNENKLIAEFMGYKVVDKPKVVNGENFFEYIGENGNYTYCNSLLEYHTSWDWLMPVVEKIESFDIISFEKNLQEDGDYQALFTKGANILICHYADTSIEATYKAVVQFINQYNKTI